VSVPNHPLSYNTNFSRYFRHLINIYKDAVITRRFNERRGYLGGRRLSVPLSASTLPRSEALRKQREMIIGSQIYKNRYSHTAGSLVDKVFTRKRGAAEPGGAPSNMPARTLQGEDPTLDGPSDNRRGRSPVASGTRHLRDAFSYLAEV
jgi:hypothetical protein